MSRHRVFAALSVFAAAGLACAQEGSLLERVRTAIGEPPAGVVTLAGSSTFLGEPGSYRGAFDADGRFRSRLESALGIRGGYNGTTAWEVDWNGMPRVLELGDDDTALLEAWAISGHWARGAAGVEVSELNGDADDAGGAGDAPDDGGERLGLSMSGGKLWAVVHVDAETSLPSRIVIELPVGEQTIALAGYERFEGLAIPTEIEITPPDGQTSTLHIAEFGSAPADTAAFAPELEPPADTRFNASIGAGLEVKRVPTGHLLVHPTVNGQDVGWFIFDTGAGSNVLSVGAAEALGLARVGNVTARGVGGAIETGFHRVDELTIGPMTVEDQAFVGLDLAFLKPYFGVDVAGILGYDMLARCVAEFDGSTDEIAIYDPAAYAAPGGAAWEPLMLPGRVPVTIGGFEGREAPFRLDTGAAGDTVSFHAPAVEEFGLLEGRETTAAMAGGVGGMVEMRKGEMASFTLGGHEFQGLPVQFATQRVGAFADAYTAGNIGGVVLGRFKLVFDYPHRRIGFIERDAE
jgi:hypothetical protein